MCLTQGQRRSSVQSFDAGGNSSPRVRLIKRSLRGDFLPKKVGGLPFWAQWGLIHVPCRFRSKIPLGFPQFFLPDFITPGPHFFPTEVRLLH